LNLKSKRGEIGERGDVGGSPITPALSLWANRHARTCKRPRPRAQNPLAKWQGEKKWPKKERGANRRPGKGLIQKAQGRVKKPLRKGKVKKGEKKKKKGKDRPAKIGEEKLKKKRHRGCS